MYVRLTVDPGQLKSVRRELAHLPGKADRAVVAALNKTVPGMRTDAVREIAKVYYVTQRDARATMTVRKASKNKMEASLRSDGSAIPLIKFRVSPKSIGRRRPRGGVRAQVRRGQGGKIAGGFIAKMGSGHVGVFTRSGDKRFPIKQRFGPAVPSMLKDIGAFGRIQSQADARLAKNLDHEVGRLLKGYGR